MSSVPHFFAGLPKDVLLMIPMESDVRSRMRGVNQYLRNTLPDITEKRFRERRITDARKCYYACINDERELASFFLRRCGSVSFDYRDQFRVWELDDSRDPKDTIVTLSLPIVQMLRSHYKRDPLFYDNIGMYCMYMFPHCNDTLAWIVSNQQLNDLKNMLSHYAQFTDHDDNFRQNMVCIIQFLLDNGMPWKKEMICWLICNDDEMAIRGMLQLPEWTLVDFLEEFEWSITDLEKELVIWCIINGRYTIPDEGDLYQDEFDFLTQIQQEITKRRKR